MTHFFCETCQYFGDNFDGHFIIPVRRRVRSAVTLAFRMKEDRAVTGGLDGTRGEKKTIRVLKRESVAERKMTPVPLFSESETVRWVDSGPTLLFQTFLRFGGRFCSFFGTYLLKTMQPNTEIIEVSTGASKPHAIGF